MCVSRVFQSILFIFRSRGSFVHSFIRSSGEMENVYEKINYVVNVSLKLNYDIHCKVDYLYSFWLIISLYTFPLPHFLLYLGKIRKKVIKYIFMLCRVPFASIPRAAVSVGGIKVNKNTRPACAGIDLKKTKLNFVNLSFR